MPLCRGWRLKGLNRVMGDYHARFLGGLGPAMAPGYPVVADLWFSDKFPKHITSFASISI